MADHEDLVSVNERTNDVEAPRVKSPAARREKLNPLPKTIDVGEQIVDSGHEFDVALVMNVGERGAQPNMGYPIFEGPVECAVIDTQDCDGKPESPVDCTTTDTPFSSSWKTPQDLDLPRMLKVKFDPKRLGIYGGLLRFVAMFGSRLEEHHVRLTGRARRIDDPPPARAPLPGEERLDVSSNAKIAPADRSNLDQVKPGLLSELNHEATLAMNAAEKLADQQNVGVLNAERNQQSYVKAVDSGPWWMALVEIALSIGIAGVAGSVGRALLNHLEAKATPIGGKLADAARVPITGVADAVKDGIKNAGRLAISGAKTLKASAEFGDSSPDRLPTPYSSDGRVEFFAQQSAVLVDVAGRNRDVIEQTRYALEPHLATNPGEAVRTMQKVNTAIRENHQEAIIRQQFATETEWVAGLARSRNGQAVATTRDGEEVGYTMMNIARLGRGRDGILTIAVKLSEPDDANPDGGLRVRSASIHGVSQAIADHLRLLDLRRYPIPIMIELGGKRSARITRDEAGIVRVSASFGPESEAYNVREATRIFERVLARPLVAWEVGPIKTDDAKGES
jgi:hypothetical protein